MVSTHPIETIDCYFEAVNINALRTGLRIKCTEGDTGSVSGITYDDITLTSINKYETSFPDFFL